MEEILKIDPVPSTRAEIYLWVDRMVARGFTAKHCCAVAKIPRQSYYMLHKRQPTATKQEDAKA